MKYPVQTRRRRSSGRSIGAKAKTVYACQRCCTWVEKGAFLCDKCNSTQFYTFRSELEAKRFGQLRLMEEQGKIKNLVLQQKYPLHAYNLKVKAPQLVGDYYADFDYVVVATGEHICEDVKPNVITDLSHWKTRHVAAQYGVRVKLVTPL